MWRHKCFVATYRHMHSLARAFPDDLCNKGLNLTSWPNEFYNFLSSADFFHNQLFFYFFQEDNQSVKQFGSRSGRTLRLIWVQTICNGYRQMTKVAASRQRAIGRSNLHRNAIFLPRPTRPGPEVIKRFSCSSQLSTKFQLLIKTRIPTNKEISCFKSLRCCIYHADKC